MQILREEAFIMRNLRILLMILCLQGCSLSFGAILGNGAKTTIRPSVWDGRQMTVVNCKIKGGKKKSKIKIILEGWSPRKCYSWSMPELSIRIKPSSSLSIKIHGCRKDLKTKPTVTIKNRGSALEFSCQ